jgi:iron(III) transport system permease protein
VTGSRVATIAILAVCVGLPLAALVLDGVLSGLAVPTLLDGRIHELLLNSLGLAALTAAFATILGAPLAAIFAFRTFPGRALLVTLSAVPLLVPQHIQAIGWMRILGRQGMLTACLEQQGIAFDVRAPFIGLYPGPAWILACAFFPLVTFSLLSGFRALDADALDAARLCAGSRGAFFRMTLRQAAPSFWGGVLLVFVFAVCAYPTPSLLDTPVLIQRVFFTFSQRSTIDGVLLALPLVLMSLVLMLLVRDADALFPAVGKGVRRVRPARGHLGFTIAAAVPVLLAAVVPIYGLVAKVIEDRALRPGAPSPFLTVFDRVRASFGHSLLFTGLGVAALLLCGWPVARHLARARGRGLDRLLFSTLALPALVLGLGVVASWSRVATVPGLGALYRNGIILVVIAYVGRFLPIVVRVLRNGFAAIDPDCEDAARLAGACAAGRTWSILLPLQAPALGVSALLAYVLCLTELDATIVTYPENFETVQVRIFNMVHYFRDEEVAALCLMVVGMALVPVALGALLFRRERTAA